MQDKNYVWLLAILFLGVGLALGSGFTGKAIFSDEVRADTYLDDVPPPDNGGEDDTGDTVLKNCELVNKVFNVTKHTWENSVDESLYVLSCPADKIPVYATCMQMPWFGEQAMDPRNQGYMDCKRYDVQHGIFLEDTLQPYVVARVFLGDCGAWTQEQDYTLSYELSALCCENSSSS